MNESYLQKLKYEDLKIIAKDMDIEVPKSKDKLIKKMLECFKLYEDYKKEKTEKYTRIKQLGNKGKEGVTYLVKDSEGREYAMKTFKKTKSASKLKTEAYLQEIAADIGVAPKIIEVDSLNKWIVMEKMDTHLTDIIKKQNGDITLGQQKQLIKIYKDLDECLVFHADSNIMNYMFKGRKLYIIDFGMSCEIDDSLIKKVGSDKPNLHIMTLGFILKLREYNCPSSSYSYLINFVRKEDIKKFNL